MKPAKNPALYRGAGYHVSCQYSSSRLSAAVATMRATPRGKPATVENSRNLGAHGKQYPREREKANRETRAPASALSCRRALDWAPVPGVTLTEARPS